MTNSNVFTSSALAVVLAATLSAPAWARTPTNLSDTNGDGVISAEEILQSREIQRAAMITEFDTDGNGELSREERKAMKTAKRAAMTAEFDTDGDGELSRDEKKAAKAARRAAIEVQLDVNGDGTVSDAEAAGLEQVREEHGKRRHGRKHDKQRS